MYEQTELFPKEKTAAPMPSSTSWNLWHGCHKCSPGCRHCYVYRRDAEFGRDSSIVRKTKAFRKPIQKYRTGPHKGLQHFDDQTISDFLCDYDAFLHFGYRQYSKECNRYFSPFENALLIRLNQYRDNYTEWVRDFSVPTTNNISERSLRFIKCKDKISGQFQSEQYAQFFAAIRTYIETCARNGINEFQAFLRLTQGNPFSLHELLSPSGAT